MDGERCPLTFRDRSGAPKVLFPEVGSQERSEARKAGGASSVLSCLWKGAGSEWAGLEQEASRWLCDHELSLSRDS